MKFVRKHLVGIRCVVALSIAAAALTACGGGGGGSNSGTTASSGSGGTLTLTGNAAGSSITGLTNFTPSNVTSVETGRTVYLWAFVNATATAGGTMSFFDYGTGGSYLAFVVSPNMTATTPDASMLGTPAGAYACVVIAATATTPAAFATSPTCASLGVAVSRTAGTISFTNSPATDSISGATSGTISGSLTFAAF